MTDVSSRLQILTELRSENESLLSFGDALDAKLNTLFGSGSLVLALFSTMGVLNSDPWWYWLVVILSAVAYFAVLFRTIRELKPKEYSFPLPTSWCFLRDKYFPMEDNDILEKLISQNLCAMEKNKTILKDKAQAVGRGLWALPIIVVVLTVCRLFVTLTT
ncbi:MAG TPA: hypothetical protein VMX56_02160 [Anaerolineales bacterium]|nr:hypothetical protein [Anaerolineales bacterium]